MYEGILKSNDLNVNDIMDIIEESDNLITIRLKTPDKGVCPSCGKVSCNPKSDRTSLYQGKGTEEIRVMLQITTRRFYCKNPFCSRSTFTANQLRKKYIYRKRPKAMKKTIDKLWYYCKVNNLDIVRFIKSTFRMDVSEHYVRDVTSDKKLDDDILSVYRPQHIGIDEYYPKGKNKKEVKRKDRVRLVLTDLDLGEVLYESIGKSQVSADRLMRDASAKFDLSEVKTVTRDLCTDWDVPLYKHLGSDIKIKVDAFHLVRNLLKKIYEGVYTKERKRFIEEGEVQKAREIFYNRYRYRKRKRKLISDDKEPYEKLKKVLQYSPSLKKSYGLIQLIYVFIDFYGSENLADAEILFSRIIQVASHFDLGSFINTLRLNKTEIFNNFITDGTQYLPEHIHSRLRHFECKRKSFRTDRTRLNFNREMLNSKLQEVYG